VAVSQLMNQSEAVSQLMNQTVNGCQSIIEPVRGLSISEPYSQILSVSRWVSEWVSEWVREGGSETVSHRSSQQSEKKTERWNVAGCGVMSMLPKFAEIREVWSVAHWRSRLLWFYCLFLSVDKVKMINSLTLRIPQNGTCVLFFIRPQEKENRNLFQHFDYIWYKGTDVAHARFLFTK
jgi:hypothetical protein